MTFPTTQLDLHLQMFLAGRWVEMAAFATTVDDVYLDVYEDVYSGRLVWNYNRLLAQSLTITHGRADETSDCQPSSLSFRLNNDDGQLTPDDPRSPWWPDLSNGAPVRVQVGSLVVFWGEAASIVPTWPSGDLSLPLAYIDVTANGILRRLGQGQKLLRSPLYRLITQNSRSVTDYWSMEDGNNSVAFASGNGGSTMSTSGMSLASDSELLGSESLPSVSSGQDGSWSASVNGTAGSWAMDWFIHMPEGPNDPGTSITTDIYTTGTHSTWRIIIGYITGDTYVWVRSFDSVGTTLVDQLLPDPSLLFGRFAHMHLKVFDNGTGIGMSTDWALVSDGTDAYEHLGAVTTGTAGKPYFTRTTVTKAPPKGVSFGHVTFHDAGLTLDWLVPADVGWEGESALARMSRLSREEGVFFSAFTGAVSGRTARMGPQKSATFLDLMREAAAADDGILCETRTVLGVQYRSRVSRYNAAVAMTLDASLGQIDNPFVPTTDDQTIRNKITGTRINGATFTAIDAASAEAPPTGDGQYDETFSVSLYSDGQVPDQVGWHKHLGTYTSKLRDLPSGQKLRYPQITLDIGKAPSLLDSWLARRVGHRIQITNPPPQHPIEGPVDLVIQGWSETYTPFGVVVTLNCSPFGRYMVAKWGDPYCSGMRSTLTNDIDSTQTTISVTTTGSPVWTTSPSGLQIRVGRSELMTVTAIGADTAGVQSFTVVRNVNGFARAHLAGESVNLYPIPVLGL